MLSNLADRFIAICLTIFFKFVNYMLERSGIYLAKF